MEISFAERLILAMYYCFLGVAGSFANITLIIFLYKHRDYRKMPSSLHLHSILIANVLACLYEIPYYVFSILASLPLPSANAYTIECRISIFLTYSISTVKMFVLTALSLDRFIAITRPYFYSGHATRKVVGIANAFFWMLPISLVLPLSIRSNYARYIGVIGASCGVSWSLIDKYYMATLMFVGYLVPTLLVAFTNVKVFLIARGQRRLISNELQRHDSSKHDTLALQTVSGHSIVTENELETGSERSFPNREANEDSMERVILQNLPSKAESAGCFSSNKVEPFVNKGNSTQKSEHSLETECRDKKSGILVNGTPNNVIKNCRTSSSSERIIDKSRKAFAIAQEEHPRPQKCSMDSESDRIQKKFRPRRSTIMQSNDWGIIFSTLILAVAFFITWSPFVLSRLFEVFATKLNARTVLYPSAITLMDIILNPLIILGTRAKMRKEYKKMFCF